jgi:hypothetical protein
MGEAWLQCVTISAALNAENVRLSGVNPHPAIHAGLRGFLFPVTGLKSCRNNHCGQEKQLLTDLGFELLKRIEKYREFKERKSQPAQ